MGWKVETGPDLAEHVIKSLKKTKSNNIPALAVFHSGSLNSEVALKEFLGAVSQVRRIRMEVSPFFLCSSLNKTLSFLSTHHTFIDQSMLLFI